MSPEAMGKVREALMRISGEARSHGRYDDSEHGELFRSIEGRAELALSLLSAAEGGGWRPINEAVEGKQYIVGWPEGDETRYDFDYFEDGFWHGWEDHYQHFCTAALSGCGQVSGPRETPPYTHCIELQPLPPPPKVAEHG